MAKKSQLETDVPTTGEVKVHEAAGSAMSSIIRFRFVPSRSIRKPSPKHGILRQGMCRWPTQCLEDNAWMELAGDDLRKAFERPR